jgi:LPXTG-motif cell wall-anchored protein
MPGEHGTFTPQSTLELHYNDNTPGFVGEKTGQPGWTFSGWSPAVAEKVTGNAVYVAQWTQNEYTVKYQPGTQGTFAEQSTGSLHYGDATPDFDGTPTGNPGWSFAGWSPAVAEKVTGDATYVAQWKQNEYTVTYAPGEHGAFEEQKTEGLHYGDDTPGFNGEPEGNDGWLFAGWSPEVAETVTGDIIYEAQWEEIVIVPTPTVPLGPVVTPTPGVTQTPAPTLSPEPTVQVPEESVPAALPVTGEQSQDWMFLAGALVLAAGAILLVFRKRKPGVK